MDRVKQFNVLMMGQKEDRKHCGNRKRETNRYVSGDAPN